MSRPRASFPYRTVGILLSVALLLLGVAVAVQRREYPHGTILLQERHVVTSARNDGLLERVRDIVPGVTTLYELADVLGDQPVVHRCGHEDAWVFRSVVEKRRERAWLGLIPHPWDGAYSNVPGYTKVLVVIRVKAGELADNPPDSVVKVIVEEGWGISSVYDPCPSPAPLPPPPEPGE